MAEPADEMHVPLTDSQAFTEDFEHPSVGMGRLLYAQMIAFDEYLNLCTVLVLDKVMEPLLFLLSLPFIILISLCMVLLRLFPEKVRFAVIEHIIICVFLLHKVGIAKSPTVGIAVNSHVTRRNAPVTRHNFGVGINSGVLNKMTVDAYTATLTRLVESLRLRQAMIQCYIAVKIYLGRMVESSDSKVKLQEIKAKIQDKFNYNGNCNVKIGIIPERSGAPTGSDVHIVHSTQLMLRLIGQAYIPGICHYFQCI